MTKLFVGTVTQAKAVRRALRTAEGLPARGTVSPAANLTYRWEPPETCEVDADGDPLPTPGWSTECVAEPDGAGGQVALEIPERLEAKLTTAQRTKLVAEDALPAALRDKRAAKRAAPDAESPRITVPKQR